MEDWRQTLSPETRGDIAGGLVLIEHLRTNFSLNIDDHKAERSDQLKGASAGAVQKILATFGEERIFLKEGGRTNRGLMKNLETLLTIITDFNLKNLPSEERDDILHDMQNFLAGRATTKLNEKKITFNYQPGITSYAIISSILEAAGARKKMGDVAEYLVGAKLALRFPNIYIRNAPVSASDDQVGESGDFQIHNSVFHVTVAPNNGHYEKCQTNLANGLRVFLLVPSQRLMFVREHIRENMNLHDSISVEAIESFVTQNIEEMSEFSGDKIAKGLIKLCRTYNNRLEDVEANLSLQIEIPKALVKNSNEK